MTTLLSAIMDAIELHTLARQPITSAELERIINVHNPSTAPTQPSGKLTTNKFIDCLKGEILLELKNQGLSPTQANRIAFSLTERIIDLINDWTPPDIDPNSQRAKERKAEYYKWFKESLTPRWPTPLSVEEQSDSLLRRSLPAQLSAKVGGTATLKRYAADLGFTLNDYVALSTDMLCNKLRTGKSLKHKHLRYLPSNHPRNLYGDPLYWDVDMHVFLKAYDKDDCICHAGQAPCHYCDGPIHPDTI